MNRGYIIAVSLPVNHQEYNICTLSPLFPTDIIGRHRQEGGAKREKIQLENECLSKEKDL